MAVKLVSNGQGLETARLARDIGLSRSAYQKALTDGAVERFLRGLVPNPLVYPSWVREHLTPELEASELCDPGATELWLEPRQTSTNKNKKPSGHEVYAAVKETGRLERSLSYGELKWLEENPAAIPADWRERGLWVYGWASVVRDADGDLRVPSLSCDVARPCVRWGALDNWWSDCVPAGLRK